MVLRKIIEIDEELCDGCGACIPGCDEGALQIVDGKARLVADKYCDGLGACLGDCPQGALKLIEREAVEYDHDAVEARLAEQLGKAPAGSEPQKLSGCPGATMMGPISCASANAAQTQSKALGTLGHWPVKIRLIPVDAPFLKNADILLLADCCGVASPNLHAEFLPDRVVLTGCPKFDDIQGYEVKLENMFAIHPPKSVTVLEMEVPCCSGMHVLAQQALDKAGVKTHVRRVIIGRDGTVMSDGPVEKVSTLG